MISVKATNRMEAKKPLADRLADVFGALGGGSTWSLQSHPQPFNAGRPVVDAEQEEDSDEEAGLGAQVMPQALIDSEDMDAKACIEDEDSAEGDNQQRPGACHTAAFRRQFEQEEEEDEYDRFADAGWQGLEAPSDSGRPHGSMEVPDGNVFDRMSEQRAASARAGAALTNGAPQDMEVETQAGTEQPATSQHEAKVPSAPPGQAPRKSVFDRLERPAPEAQQSTQAVQAHGPTGGGMQEANQGADAVGQSVGTEEGADATMPGGARQGKRVRFTANTAAGKSGAEVAQAGRGRAIMRPARGGRGRPLLLNWQRPGYVPDHVKHPERYTVYDLGEGLTVGGGDQAGSASADAALLRQAVSSSQAVARGTPTAEGEADGGAPEQAEKMVLAVGAGAVQFKPRGQRQGAASEPSQATGRTASAAAAGIGGMAVAGLAGEEPEGADTEAAAAPQVIGAAHGGSGRGGAPRRQFRTKTMEDN